MNRVTGQHTTLEREQDAAGKNRIKKAEGIPDQQQACFAAVLRVVRILAGNEILTDLLAARDVVFDPDVFLNLSFEDRFGRFHSVAAEVFALGNDAHADHIIVLRDVPEPALFRNVSDRGRTLIQARIAFGSAIIGPDRDFVQIGIADAPVDANGREGLLA